MARNTDRSWLAPHTEYARTDRTVEDDEKDDART
ncbi:MAG: hypothetical protein ACI8TL_001313 [Natronomonas sp.]|jgi:hypothetical protein